MKYNVRKENHKLPFKFRTFTENDQSGIIKTYMAAFCKAPVCEPMAREFWEWKYGPNRPFYDPAGYQVCEYNGRVVGSIQSTLRTMNFNGLQFHVAGIDDVATCPRLEKRGIARHLMENAFEFMKKHQVDLSILGADPRGHARKLYNRLGYTHITYFSLGAKLISMRNTVKDFTILTPLAFPMRLYGALRTKLGRQKFRGNIKFEIFGRNQEEFRQKINRIYHSFYSFEDYSSEYWKWYYIDRPKGQESVVLAAKEKNSIIAGGVMIRSHLMVIDTRKRVPVYVLSEFFVDPAYRRSGLGSYVLSQLESIIKQKGGSVVITTLHGRDTRFQEFLKHMGYIIIKKAVVQMIKPISERSIQLFRIIEGKKMVWKVPLEQLGY